MNYPYLQSSFETKITQYEEEQKMPLLSYMEERGMEKGLQEGVKYTRREDIIQLLERRFKVQLSETLVNRINSLEDVKTLNELFLQAIDISSCDEFAQLLNSLSLSSRGNS